MPGTEPGAAPSIVAEIGAKLELTLDGVRGIDRRMSVAERMLRRPPMQPAATRIVRTGIFAEVNPLLLTLDFGGPRQGHLWYVRAVTVGGLSPDAVVGGRADVFTSGADLRFATSLAQLGLADWRDQAVVLPLVGFYGRGELAIYNPEELFVIFSEADEGTEYVAVATVEDFEQAADREVFGL